MAIVSVRKFWPQNRPNERPSSVVYKSVPFVGHVFCGIILRSCTACLPVVKIDD